VITLFDETGTVEGLAQLLTELELQPLVRGVLILAAEGNGFTPETVDALLGASALPLMGGIFPLVIFKGRHYIQGTVVCGIDVMPEVVVIPGMSDPDMDFEYYLEKEFYPTCKRGTLWLWVDGLATRTEALLRGWFNLYGLDYNVIGGGAGSASFKPMPCLFTNDGLLQDKAVIALLDMPSGVGAFPLASTALAATRSCATPSSCAATARWFVWAMCRATPTWRFSPAATGR
jgi:hypothetical protein